MIKPTFSFFFYFYLHVSIYIYIYSFSSYVFIIRPVLKFNFIIQLNVPMKHDAHTFLTSKTFGKNNNNNLIINGVYIAQFQKWSPLCCDFAAGKSSQSCRFTMMLPKAQILSALRLWHLPSCNYTSSSPIPWVGKFLMTKLSWFWIS